MKTGGTKLTTELVVEAAGGGRRRRRRETYYFVFNMETEANYSRNFKTRVHKGNNSKDNKIYENSKFCLLI
jgi:hypothetical protein